MKAKIIEMYRPSQYKSWEEAHDMGGVHRAHVPEGTSDTTVMDLIITVNNCMGGDDRLMWRYKPAELTALQKAFIAAYRNNVGVATPEQVEVFVRHPSNSHLHSMSESEYYKLLEAYDMFMAGRASYAAGL
jgi:hypothetical protein